MLLTPNILSTTKTVHRSNTKFLYPYVRSKTIGVDQTQVVNNRIHIPEPLP